MGYGELDTPSGLETTDSTGETVLEPAKGHKKTVLVDFDGVLHSYTSGWQGGAIIPDRPVKGALRWLERLVLDGRFDVCVYSARSRHQGGPEAMRDWLYHWNFPVGLLEDGILQFPTEKLPGCLTIDDRCWIFGGPGTFPTPDEIDNYKPWTKDSAELERRKRLALDGFDEWNEVTDTVHGSYEAELKSVIEDAVEIGMYGRLSIAARERNGE
jgi:hypothetical protein